MDILKSLGVDSTLWIQLVCFLISYVALSTLVFRPYFNAYHEREKRTVGNEEATIRVVNEAQGLESNYEQKARAINSSIKSVYEQSRTEAMREYDRVSKSAREQAGALLEDARQVIAREVEAARKSLTSEVPAVSAAIASKLAGKDL